MEPDQCRKWECSLGLKRQGNAGKQGYADEGRTGKKEAKTTVGKAKRKSLNEQHNIYLLDLSTSLYPKLRKAFNTIF